MTEFHMVDLQVSSYSTWQILPHPKIDNVKLKVVKPTKNNA